MKLFADFRTFLEELPEDNTFVTDLEVESIRKQLPKILEALDLAADTIEHFTHCEELCSGDKGFVKGRFDVIKKLGES